MCSMTEFCSEDAIYLERAQCALSEGHENAGLALCEAVLKRNPFSVNALRVVDACWRERKPASLRLQGVRIRFAILRRLYRGMPHKALALAHYCLLRGLQDPSVYELLASSSCALEAWSMARFAYETLIQRGPDSLDYPLELARVCLALGEVEEALVLTRDLLHRVPGHLEAQALAREAAVLKAMESSAPKGQCAAS